MDNKDKMQRELMSKLAELESKHKRRLPPDDIHLRLRRDMDKAQKDTPVISKELFCTAIHLLKEQESIHRNETDIVFREEGVCVVPNTEIISAKPGHILDDDRCHIAPAFSRNPQQRRLHIFAAIAENRHTVDEEGQAHPPSPVTKLNSWRMYIDESNWDRAAHR